MSYIRRHVNPSRHSLWQLSSSRAWYGGLFGVHSAADSPRPEPPSCHRTCPLSPCFRPHVIQMPSIRPRGLADGLHPIHALYLLESRKHSCNVALACRRSRLPVRCSLDPSRQGVFTMPMSDDSGICAHQPSRFLSFLYTFHIFFQCGASTCYGGDRTGCLWHQGSTERPSRLSATLCHHMIQNVVHIKGSPFSRRSWHRVCIGPSAAPCHVIQPHALACFSHSRVMTLPISHNTCTDWSLYFKKTLITHIDWPPTQFTSWISSVE